MNLEDKRQALAKAKPLLKRNSKICNRIPDHILASSL
jgi:hypothetical protein